MGFEIAEQLGWTLPDVILYPTGGGVGLIGIYKALRGCRSWAGCRDRCRDWWRCRRAAAPHRPGLAAGERESRFWPDSQTLAFGINVPKALGIFWCWTPLSHRGLRRRGGRWRHPARTASTRLSGGLLRLPGRGGRLRRRPPVAGSGLDPGGERVVVLNTGAGIKCPDAITVVPQRLRRDGGSRHELRLVFCSHHPAGVRSIGLGHLAARRHRDPHLARRGAAQCDAAKPAQALAERGDPRLWSWPATRRS